MHYIIPNESELETKNVKINKIDVDDLFNIATNKEVNPTEQMNYKIVDLFAEEFVMTPKKEEEKAKAYSPPKNKEISKIIVNNDSDDSPEYYLLKKYYIIINQVYYGPYTAEDIYLYLLKLYANDQKLKEKQLFMISDVESDIYYIPSTLFEILGEQLKGTNVFKDKAADFISPILPYNEEKIKETKERKLPVNMQLITKYDVYYLNNKFKNNAKYIPIRQLNKQLKDIRINSNFEKNNNFTTKNTANNFDFSLFNKHAESNPEGIGIPKSTSNKFDVTSSSNINKFILTPVNNSKSFKFDNFDSNKNQPSNTQLINIGKNQVVLEKIGVEKKIEDLFSES